MGRPANFVITEDKPDRVVLEDRGPWDVHFTITNDAEGVLARLDRKVLNLCDKRVFYIDSEGDRTELIHDEGRFIGFGAGRDQ